MSRLMRAVGTLWLALPLTAAAAAQTGVVQSGALPVAGASVTLLAAASDSSPAKVLARTRTDGRGSFSLQFTPPATSQPVLYLLADGGVVAGVNGAAPQLRRLATVLGATATAGAIVINERTTVATAYAMARFLHDRDLRGGYPGLQNAAVTLRNLVDVASGEIAPLLATSPNGLDTSTLAEFNSLANLAAACVRDQTGTSCADLISLATLPGSAAPTDTLAALVDVARNPSHNVMDLFKLSQTVSPYAPALPTVPDAWTLAVRYAGNGHEFDGPGNMAFDRDGNIWSTNNYTYDPNPADFVCGGLAVIKLTPSGEDAPGAPYSGGGTYGAGFGITIDPRGNVWVGNFFFEGLEQGKDCSDPLYQRPPSTNVSEFSADGAALSQNLVGYTDQGSISQPQGMEADAQGNVWIASCGGNNVTRFPDGNPRPPYAQTFTPEQLSRPFGLALDGAGNAWVSSSGNDLVFGVTPAGTAVPGSPFHAGRAPLGVAVDSLGNVWVANSAAIQLPCGDATGRPLLFGTPSITEVRPGAREMQSRDFGEGENNGGLTAPWGIAVDGDDHIWVANFAGSRLSEFCGERPETCPAGSATGDPISPPSGYGSDALTRNTGVVIDPSGNVWLANNWLDVPQQTNPGGHELVVFIGLAAPVVTPMNGPPRRPQP